MGEQAYFDPPVPEHDVDAEIPPTVLVAQSTPNDVAHPPVLLNAIKAVNPDMHYEYIPRPDAWKDRRQIFFRAFW
jgi:hypothetical protein